MNRFKAPSVNDRGGFTFLFKYDIIKSSEDNNYSFV